MTERPMAVAFNEMFVRDGECRRGYEFLQRWIQSTPPDILAHRRAEAELLFRQNQMAPLSQLKPKATAAAAPRHKSAIHLR